MTFCKSVLNVSSSLLPPSYTPIIWSISVFRIQRSLGITLAQESKQDYRLRVKLLTDILIQTFQVKANVLTMVKQLSTDPSA